MVVPDREGGLLTKLRRGAKKTAKQPTAYQVLSVPPGATDKKVHEVFRKLAAANHPDRGGDPVRSADINLAYGLVKSPEMRARYNAQLKLAGRLNCGVCDGEGLVRRQKSFTKVELHLCPQCQGQGEVE